MNLDNPYWCLLPLLLLHGWVTILEAQQSILTVVAPRALRPHSEYVAAVTLHGEGSRIDEIITVEVKGLQEDGKLYQKTKAVSVRGRSSMLAKITIDELTPGNYNLTVYGSGSLISFRKSTKLNYVPKSASVFIQLDRSVYKPGITANFRVIVLDSQLRPISQKPVDILVTDGNGNEVRRWNQVVTHFGCFIGDIPLSHSPVLGEWNIRATVAEESYNKTFLVAEYVLPKFQVDIDLPTHATFEEAESLSAKVTAKYSNGRYVKGELTISAYPTYHTEILQPVFRNPVRRVLPIDGEITVTFNLVKEFGISDDFQRLVNFDVGVEETVSGSRQNASATIHLHKYSNKIELVEPSEFYQPGLKFKPMIKVTKFDGSPLGDLKNPVKVKAGFTFDGKEHSESFHTLNRDGMTELNFDPSLGFNSTSLLEIEAEYPDASMLRAVVHPSLSPSKSFIQVLLKTKGPRVNEEVQVEVVSTVALPHITYVVMGRGEILFTRTVVPNNPSQSEKTISITFLATRAMAPAARFIAYFVPPGSKEIVANGLDIKFSKTFQNFVTINMSPVVESRPGSEVTFTFLAKPYSHMAIMGVDEKVLALGKDYNLSPEKIMEDVNSYFGSHSDNRMSSNYLDKSTYYSTQSGVVRDVFNRYDAVILTNGQSNNNWITNNPWRDQPQFVAGIGSGEPFNRNQGATRPPLAGPYAFSRIPAPSWDYRPRVHVLMEPSNTWIFTNVSTGADGKVTLKRTLPNNMTSWLVTAFSLDSVHGIGLLNKQIKIIGKRSFYINVDFPPTAFLREVVSISVAVSNFMNQDLTVDVTLDNSDGSFEFVENGGKEFRSLLQKKNVVLVKPSTTTITVFMVIPKQTGQIDVKVKAVSSSLRDAMTKKLLVKAEGETVYGNQAIFVDLRNSNRFAANFTVDLPKYFVEGSEVIKVSAVGDLLGNSISNLAKLIRMPSGCGEQNMAKLVPNIAVLEYLKNTKQLTKAVETKAIEYIEMGYQQQLSYRRKDGSFSAFGSRDPIGSTWLSAFVAKYISQASALLDGSRGQPLLLQEGKKVAEEALVWLKSVQASNGSFPEVGTINYEDMQGSGTEALPLTAYTLLTFIDNQKNKEKPTHQNVINKALDYIVRNLDGLEDPYAISLCAYALHVAKHSAKETAFHLLEPKAKTKGDMKWWQKEVTLSESKNPWVNSSSRTANVEMSAYALLTYLERGLVEDALPIAKWLFSQQNSLGGFASTQDTAVGIYALVRLAEVLQPGKVDMTVTFLQSGKEVLSEMHITKENALVLQKAKVPQSAREISVEAKGNGIAIVQMSYQYNLNVTGAWPLFTLDPQVDKSSNVYHLQLSVCSGYFGGNMSNMALMEVFLPSGFLVDMDSLPSLRVSPSVKRVETHNDGTSVALYFDQMIKKEYCPTISAYRTHGVAWNRPVPVVVYDYYDMTRKARVFYKPIKSNLCDLCNEDNNGPNCLLACGMRPQSQKDQSENEAAEAASSATRGSMSHFSTFSPMIISIILLRTFQF